MKVEDLFFQKIRENKKGAVKAPFFIFY